MLSSQDRLVKLENLLDRLQRNKQNRPQKGPDQDTTLAAKKTRLADRESSASAEASSFDAMAREAAALAESAMTGQEAPIDLVPRTDTMIHDTGLPESSGEQIIDENSRIISAKSGSAVLTNTDEFAGASVDEILSVPPRDVLSSRYSEAPEDEIMELDPDDILEDDEEEYTETEERISVVNPAVAEHISQRPSIEAAGTEFDIEASTASAEPLPLIELHVEKEREEEQEILDTYGADEEVDAEMELTTIPSAKRRAPGKEDYFEREIAPESDSIESLPSPALHKIEPRPAPETRLYEPNVTASEEVASMRGDLPKPLEWSIDAVLERAWKVGAQD